jgi:NAD-dependent deacetylase
MDLGLIQQAANLLLQAEYPIALTGAGISTPSGIPDFRSGESGLWERFDPMEVASLSSFKHHPERYYEWALPLTRTILDAQPNPAHYALAQLEKLGKLNSIITQNIDALHSKAGSVRVHEVHGHMREATCIECFRIYEARPLYERLLAQPDLKVLRCQVCGGALKPNVILFGEQLPVLALEASERDTKRCDLMLIAGSSLEVYPVADLPRRAKARGAKLVIINYDATDYDRSADVVIHGDVAEVLPQIVQAVEAGI